MNAAETHGSRNVTMPDDPNETQAHLSHAGAVVDKAIEYMMGQNLSSLAIASALLGGSMALLARSMSDDAIIGILNNAIGSVRSGELRDGPEQNGH
jgi:hypothetical protein